MPLLRNRFRLTLPLRSRLRKSDEADAGPKTGLGSAGGFCLSVIGLPLATGCERVCATAPLHHTILHAKDTKSGKAPK